MWRSNEDDSSEKSDSFTRVRCIVGRDPYRGRRRGAPRNGASGGRASRRSASSAWVLLAASLALVTACDRAKRTSLEEVKIEDARMSPSVDPDQAFLRRMLNHHAGLTLISHAAIERAHDEETRNAARYVDLRHDVERDRLRRILREEFGDSTPARVLPEHSVAADSLAILSGGEYDRAFRHWVVAHHREALRMIENALPGLRRFDVRSLAREIRENQLRELTELEAELSGR